MTSILILPLRMPFLLLPFFFILPFLPSEPQPDPFTYWSPMWSQYGMMMRKSMRKHMERAAFVGFAIHHEISLTALILPGYLLVPPLSQHHFSDRSHILDCNSSNKKNYLAHNDLAKFNSSHCLRSQCSTSSSQPMLDIHTIHRSSCCNYYHAALGS